MEFDEDGARSPGSSLVTIYALVALFGQPTIRRVGGRLVGCNCHEIAVLPQRSASSSQGHHRNHLSSTVRQRPDVCRVLRSHSLWVQELLIGGSDIKGTIKGGGSVYLVPLRFLDAGTSPFHSNCCLSLAHGRSVYATSLHVLLEDVNRTHCTLLVQAKCL